MATVWTALLIPVSIVAMAVTANRGVGIWMARRLWAPVFFWVGGSRLVVEGAEHVEPSRPTIYLSNHQSTADIPTLFLAIPVNVRFVVKQQLVWVPILGWFILAGGHVLIDRRNRDRAIASLETAAARIRGGLSIIIYPEGTRSDDGSVLPFKKGPFVLAQKAGVAVCPVTIEGSGRAMPKNSWRITPGTIRVKIGAPIDAAGFADHERERLLREVRDRIIDQSLAMGGVGGDRERCVAAQGHQGGDPAEA